MISQNISDIYKKICHAAMRAGRDPSEIRMLAVTKTVNAQDVKEAAEAGLRMFGENRVQEARDKIPLLQAMLPDMQMQWHLIGNLQKNKAKYAVQLFDLIHTVDSLELADILDREARKTGKIQDVLVQVKLSAEETKHGSAEADAPALAIHISTLKNLRLRGLMTIPPFFEISDNARQYFTKLRLIRDTIEAHGIRLPELSIGMSHDFETAIEEGATIVRIGTAIFGQRR